MKVLLFGFLALGFLAPLAQAAERFELLRVFDPAGERKIVLSCEAKDFCELALLEGAKQTKQIAKAVGRKWLNDFSKASQPLRAAIVSDKNKKAGKILSWDLSADAKQSSDVIYLVEDYEKMPAARKRTVTAVVDFEQKLLAEFP